MKAARKVHTKTKRPEAAAAYSNSTADETKLSETPEEKKETPHRGGSYGGGSSGGGGATGKW